MIIRRACVFCGSSSGAHPEYAVAAQEVGTLLAKESIGLVYGGSKTGLMGEIADAVLRAGGEVIGVIPRSISRHGRSRTQVSPNFASLKRCTNVRP